MDLWLKIAIAGAVLIGTGFSLRAINERKIAKHKAKLDDRLAAGQDRYFEELRELKAYDPKLRPIWQNTFRELSLAALALAGLLIVFADL